MYVCIYVENQSGFNKVDNHEINGFDDLLIPREISSLVNYMISYNIVIVFSSFTKISYIRHCSYNYSPPVDLHVSLQK